MVDAARRLDFWNNTEKRFRILQKKEGKKKKKVNRGEEGVMRVG